jgi:hypothetical protein
MPSYQTLKRIKNDLFYSHWTIEDLELVLFNPMTFLVKVALLGIFVWAVGPWGVAIGVLIAVLSSISSK